jgi:penicillin-binding protein 1A
MKDRKGGERREPIFDIPESRDDLLDLRLTPQDRAGGHFHEDDMARKAAKKPAGKAAGKSPSRSPGNAGTRGSGRGGGGNGGGGRRRSPRRRRSFIGRIFYASFVLGLWAMIGVAGIVAYHATQLPPIDQLKVPKRPPNIAILASDGTLVANRGETGGQNVSIRDLPPHLPRAFVAIEDRRFYSHFGVDPVGIARALMTNVTSGQTMQGGSTLTQQLAKNLFLTQERTASRKIQEAILSLWLEAKYSKDEILELYMNRVYFGAGAYGVDGAARRYFDKPAEDVTVAEAAMLAGLVQAPSRLAPTRDPRAARARASLVLAAMQDLGFISETQEKTALASPAEVSRPGGAGTANYAADYVMDVLDDFIGSVEDDIVVMTTIDLDMQRAAEASLIAELTEQGPKFDVQQGALVSIRPDGAVKALVGGKNYQESQFNRAIAARRQPGSAFKPFVYLAAVEHGLTPDTIRNDAPVQYGNWRPENFSRDFRGPVPLRTALALSLNTVAVSLGMEVGPREVVRAAQRLGIASPLQPNASIALGTSEVTPLELVGAYAAFANGGTGVIPHIITRVETTNGRLVYERVAGGLGRVIDENAVSMMNAMLHETMVAGTGRRAVIDGWETAGKTGTSQEFRDAWFVGYTGTLVTGVWLGNDDNKPTRRASGGNVPLDVWTRYMKTALAGDTPVQLPGGGYWLAPEQGVPMVAVEPDPRYTGTPSTGSGNDSGWIAPAPQEQGQGLLGRLFGIY